MELQRRTITVSQASLKLQCCWLTSITLIFFSCCCTLCLAVSVTCSRPSLLRGDTELSPDLLTCLESLLDGDVLPCFGFGLKKYLHFFNHACKYVLVIIIYLTLDFCLSARLKYI